ncbi:MAG TPA: hypothetical protein VGJ77_15700 [Gaiellaceae bacterium]|jgi:hypothetical protein
MTLNRRCAVKAIWIAAVLAAATVLVAAGPSTAAQPFDRCLDDPALVPGPGACTFDFTVENFFPAGTRCDFDVEIVYELSGTIYFFDNPPRAVAHIAGDGTATGNGHTLRRISHFTETASPEIVFTDHGLKARYTLPGGRTITVYGGYERDSIVPPEPQVFHGNPFDELDRAAFCAALT